MLICLVKKTACDGPFEAALRRFQLEGAQARLIEDREIIRCGFRLSHGRNQPSRRAPFSGWEQA